MHLFFHKIVVFVLLLKFSLTFMKYAPLCEYGADGDY